MSLKKRVIIDNDGCDAALVKNDDYNEFISKRLFAIKDTAVTTLFYNGHDQFGLVKFKPESDDFQCDLSDSWRNSNPIDYSIRFCRENGKEFFFGVRMNDIHDGDTDITSESHKLFLSNRFKLSHPDCLLGSLDSPPPHTAFSSVNYSKDEVRRVYLALIGEICERFDIDGLYLDFYRHLIGFENPACGLHASNAEIDVMTELMRETRELLKRDGKNRELAVRVPDSVEFALFCGYDIERWLSEGLIDAMITSGYHQFNYWDYSVRLGHKYGVSVYPSLDEPRFSVNSPSGDNPRLRRRTFEATRGRVNNALSSGADGYMLFNYRYPETFRTIDAVTAPEKLRNAPKHYFLSWRSIFPNNYSVDFYKNYMKIPCVTPLYGEVAAFEVKIDGEYDTEIYIGQTCAPDNDVFLILWLDTENAGFRVYFNGSELTEGIYGQLLPEYLPYETYKLAVPGGLVVKGVNKLHLTAAKVCVLSDLAVYIH